MAVLPFLQTRGAGWGALVGETVAQLGFWGTPTNKWWGEQGVGRRTPVKGAKRKGVAGGETPGPPLPPRRVVVQKPSPDRVWAISGESCVSTSPNPPSRGSGEGVALWSRMESGQPRSCGLTKGEEGPTMSKGWRESEAKKGARPGGVDGGTPQCAGSVHDGKFPKPPEGGKPQPGPGMPGVPRKPVPGKGVPGGPGPKWEKGAR